MRDALLFTILVLDFVRHLDTVAERPKILDAQGLERILKDPLQFQVVFHPLQIHVIRDDFVDGMSFFVAIEDAIGRKVMAFLGQFDRRIHIIRLILIIDAAVQLTLAPPQIVPPRKRRFVYQDHFNRFLCFNFDGVNAAFEAVFGGAQTEIR